MDLDQEKHEKDNAVATNPKKTKKNNPDSKRPRKKRRDMTRKLTDAEWVIVTDAPESALRDAVEEMKANCRAELIHGKHVRIHPTEKEKKNYDSEYRKEYRARDYVKERQLLDAADEAKKQKKKEYANRPDVKARKSASQIASRMFKSKFKKESPEEFKKKMDEINKEVAEKLAAKQKKRDDKKKQKIADGGNESDTDTSSSTSETEEESQ